MVTSKHGDISINIPWNHHCCWKIPSSPLWMHHHKLMDLIHHFLFSWSVYQYPMSPYSFLWIPYECISNHVKIPQKHTKTRETSDLTASAPPDSQRRRYDVGSTSPAASCCEDLPASRSSCRPRLPNATSPGALLEFHRAKMENSNIFQWCSRRKWLPSGKL